MASPTSQLPGTGRPPNSENAASFRFFRLFFPLAPPLTSGLRGAHSAWPTREPIRTPSATLLVGRPLTDGGSSRGWEGEDAR